MEKGFAYISRGGIMHITEDMQTAIDMALKGTRVVETQFEHKFGYPVVNGEGIIVYSPDEMKVDGGGEKIAVIPELARLYGECGNRK